jgi:hypothetical protein
MLACATGIKGKLTQYLAIKAMGCRNRQVVKSRNSGARLQRAADSFGRVATRKRLREWRDT